jgi:Domain of unknown function (DUF1816)
MSLVFSTTTAKPDLAWWLEVGTLKPFCVYYFGPFETEQEVAQSKHGFLQDLRNEQSMIIFSRSNFCQPRQLTIHQNELTIQDLELTPVHFFEALVA